MFAKSSYAALCGLLALSSAHMIPSQPKPFPGTNNSPIDGSGANFPCQGRTPGGNPESMALGSTQPLTFTGQAVHGGGSCQVSITYDTNPTKNSVWKVLHSIQGGCPAKGEPLNMGSDASAADPYTYSFPIPSNIPAGEATLAWSWLNRIGNREFYMACSSVKLTGTGGAQSNYDALPDMAVANIPSINSCRTEERSDYIYPNPGSSVESFPFSSSSLQKIIADGDDDCRVKSAPRSGGSSGGSGGAGSPSSAPPATTAKPSATPVVSPGVFVTSGAGVPASSTAVATSAQPSSTAAPGSSNGSSSGGSTGSGSSGSGSGSSGSSSGSSSSSSAGAQAIGAKCTDGDWACVGGTSFQRCGSGSWSPVMPLAAGTKCTGASGGNINIVGANGKVKRVSRRFSSL